MRLLNRQHVLSFGGGHIEIGPHVDFDLSETLTLAAWVRPAVGQGLQATILSKDYTAYEPQVQNSRFVFERGSEYSSTEQRPIALNHWVHLVATFDANAANANLKLYINGELNISYDLTTSLTITTGPLLIGKRPGWDDGLFRGEMAGLAIWRRALSAWQIRQVVSSPINRLDDDLVAYWQMDEGEGSTLLDSSRNQHHGSFQGEVSWAPLSVPIALNPRNRQLRPHTSIKRLSDLTEVATRSLRAPQDISAGPATATHQPLPPSGRNGEAQNFLNRVKLYNQQRVQEQKLAATQQIKEAKQSSADKLQAAQQEASQKINSTRFDYLYFLYNGKIHRVDPKGQREEFFVGDVTTTSRQVIAAQLWQDTGVIVAKGETVRIRYISGLWSVSSDDANLTAAGTARFPGLDTYALPGANPGALIGRIGGTVFLIGNGATAPSDLEGELQLITNDDIPPKYGRGYSDNSGAITVEITHEKQPISVLASDVALDLVRRQVFWSQAHTPFTLHAASLDGNNHRAVLQEPDLPITSVALDTVNQQVYYIAGVGKIYAVAYDGSSHREVLDISGPAKEHYWQLVVDNDNQQLYWTNDYSIWRANLDGSGAHMVVPTYEAPFPIDLAVDGEEGKLYWVDKELQVVRRANLDGSHPEDLYLVQHPIRGLTLDEVTADQQTALKKEVYWSAWEERITANTPGAVGVWPLDEGQGNVLHNRVNRFRHVMLEPNDRQRASEPPRWLYTDVPPLVHLPQAVLALNGTSDYVKLGSAKAFFLTNHSFTVECWLKAATLDAGDLPLLTTDGSAPSQGLFLAIRDKKAYMGFGADDLAGESELSANTWLHLAFRYNAETREQAIFLNGQVDARRTANQNFLGEEMVYLGCGPQTHFFHGLISNLRLWQTPRSDEEIIRQMRNYRDSFTVRGAADGSSRPEYLFEVPCEGGLNLVSKLSADHEQRLLAYRQRQAAQEQADRTIADAHTQASATVADKTAELQKAHADSETAINTKQAQHEQERGANRLRLNQSKDSTKRQIENANQAAAQKRQDAQTQAATIQNQANADAERMKSTAQEKRDAARRERDKYN